MPLAGKRMACRAARFGIAALALLTPLGGAAGEPWRFDQTIVDAANAGDCKMAGDIDGDGFPDLIIGGSPKEKLVWYQWPTCRKTEVAVPAVEFTTDGALADPAAAAELGRTARRRAEAFSIEASAAGYEALYRDLISQAAPMPKPTVSAPARMNKVPKP
jgi:hypothetical protein